MTLENQDQNKKSFLRKLLLQKEVRGRKAEEVSFDSSVKKRVQNVKMKGCEGIVKKS